jgi:hypothetical protein
VTFFIGWDGSIAIPHLLELGKLEGLFVGVRGRSLSRFGVKIFRTIPIMWGSEDVIDIDTDVIDTIDHRRISRNNLWIAFSSEKQL